MTARLEDDVMLQPPVGRGLEEDACSSGCSTRSRCCVRGTSTASGTRSGRRSSRSASPRKPASSTRGRSSTTSWISSPCRRRPRCGSLPPRNTRRPFASVMASCCCRSATTILFGTEVIGPRAGSSRVTRAGRCTRRCPGSSTGTATRTRSRRARCHGAARRDPRSARPTLRADRCQGSAVAGTGW